MTRNSYRDTSLCNQLRLIGLKQWVLCVSGWHLRKTKIMFTDKKKCIATGLCHSGLFHGGFVCLFMGVLGQTALENTTVWWWILSSPDALSLLIWSYSGEDWWELRPPNCILQGLECRYVPMHDDRWQRCDGDFWEWWINIKNRVPPIWFLMSLSVASANKRTKESVKDN